MSHQFNVQAIMILEEDVYDLPKGLPVCQDLEGRWYRQRRDGPHKSDDELNRMKACWPKPSKLGITLFRDYWMVMNADGLPNDSPYMTKFLEAKKTTIVEMPAKVETRE